jgi:hypothetical protein
MKKSITSASTQLLNHFPKKISISILIFSSVLVSPTLRAQSYTYTKESFEDVAWSSATNNTNSIVAATGTWSTAKNNIQSNTVTAQDGTYSLYFATKTNGLITPSLDNGAGVLTYNVTKTSSRSIMVSTSTDNVNWSATIDSFYVTATWTGRTVNINNPSIRYIRFQTNSNGGVYIDNVLITRPSGTTSLIQNGDSKINCFPTLVENNLNIDFRESNTGNANIDICAINGQKVFSFSRKISSQESVKLNLQELNSGIYIATVKMDNRIIFTRRFIKN